MENGPVETAPLGLKKEEGPLFLSEFRSQENEVYPFRLQSSKGLKKAGCMQLMPSESRKCVVRLDPTSRTHQQQLALSPFDTSTTGSSLTFLCLHGSSPAK